MIINETKPVVGATPAKLPVKAILQIINRGAMEVDQQETSSSFQKKPRNSLSLVKLRINKHILHQQQHHQQRKKRTESSISPTTRQEGIRRQNN